MKFRNPISATKESHRSRRGARLATDHVSRSHPPAPGALLHRIRVETFIGAKQGFEILIRQGPRRNQIVAETFGTQSKPHGVDWLMRNLRKRTVTRWMPNV